MKSVPFFRQIVQRKNGGYRADGNAGAAIDALDGVDIKHLRVGEAGIFFFRMDTIDRARVNAGGVFGADAGFSNYISHINRETTNVPYEVPRRKRPAPCGDWYAGRLLNARAIRKIENECPSLKFARQFSPQRVWEPDSFPPRRRSRKRCSRWWISPIIQYGVEEALHSGIQNIIIVHGPG